jgi:hypothetical protein
MPEPAEEPEAVAAIKPASVRLTAQPEIAVQPLKGYRKIWERNLFNIKEEKAPASVKEIPIEEIACDKSLFTAHRLNRKYITGEIAKTAILPVTDSKARTWHTVRLGDYPSRQEAVKHAEAFTSREKIACAVRPFEKL